MRGATPSGRRGESLRDSPHLFLWGGKPSPHPSPALRAARPLHCPRREGIFPRGSTPHPSPAAPGAAEPVRTLALSPTGGSAQGGSTPHRATRRKEHTCSLHSSDAGCYPLGTAWRIASRFSPPFPVGRGNPSPGAWRRKLTPADLRPPLLARPVSVRALDRTPVPSGAEPTAVSSGPLDLRGRR